MKTELTAIQPNQGLWQDLHNKFYDSPTRAQAFPEPRTSHDWRKRVVERHLVLRFLEEQEDLLSKVCNRCCTLDMAPPCLHHTEEEVDRLYSARHILVGTGSWTEQQRVAYCLGEVVAPGTQRLA